MVVKKIQLYKIMELLPSLNETHAFLIRNIHEYVKLINTSANKNDIEILGLINSIEIYVGHLMDGVYDKSMITMDLDTKLNDEVFGEVKRDIILPIIEDAPEIARKEHVTFVQKMVKIYIDYSAIINNAGTLMDALNDITKGQVTRVEKAISNVQDIVQTMSSLFSLTSNSDRKVHHTSSFDFMSFLGTTWDNIKMPKNILKLGIKAFNEMLSKDGGLLPKSYLIHAGTNTFKTALLLYIGLWIKRYNGHLFKKEIAAGLKPTVLIINLENGLSENNERFFKMASGMDMRDIGSAEMLKKVWSETFDEDNSIELTLIQDGPGKMSPQDIETIIKDLERNGYKVIACIIDYLRLLKCTADVKSDLRLSLVHNATEFHNLSKKYEIPFVTAHHTNAKAKEKIDELIENGTYETTKYMNRGHISEASSLEDPVDFSFWLNRVSNAAGDMFIELQRGKCRYTPSDVDHFILPVTNGIVLKDDLNLTYNLHYDKVPEFIGENFQTRALVSKEIGLRGKASINSTFDKVEMALKLAAKIAKPLVIKELNTIEVGGFEYHSDPVIAGSFDFDEENKVA